MITIYTDGACRGNQQENNIGAWGVYLTYGGHSKQLSGTAVNTTNNKMEIQAVIEGLKTLKVKDIPITIYSDSQYVISGITEWIHNWIKNNWKTSTKKIVENREQWEELYELVSSFDSVEFIKVKGHSGNEGNELVDKLCNETMDNFETETSLKNAINNSKELIDETAQQGLSKDVNLIHQQQAYELFEQLRRAEEEIKSNVAMHFYDLRAIVQNPDFTTSDMKDDMLEIIDNVRESFGEDECFRRVLKLCKELDEWVNKLD